MAVFVPTTIIGVGTSGCITVAWLSRLLYQEFGNHVPEFIRLAVMDTEVKGLNREYHAEPITLGPLNVNSIEAAWHNLDTENHVSKWFAAAERRRVSAIKTDFGAGNERAVGRLCFWSNLQRSIFANAPDQGANQPYSSANRQAAATHLSNSLGVIVHPSRAATEDQPNAHYIDDSQHHYYIVGSATGGTASGSIIDVAQLAASTSTPTKVVILLTLPPETLQSAEGLGNNAAATLIDVWDMVLRPGNIAETVERYPNGQEPTARARFPAQAVYLLGPSAPGSRGSEMLFTCKTGQDIQEGLAMTSAYWLYASLFGMGAELHGRIEDYNKRLDDLADGKAWPPNRTTHLRAFALGGVARPTWLLAELVTKRLLERQIKQWTTCTEAHRIDEWKRRGRIWMTSQIDTELLELGKAIESRDTAAGRVPGRETGADLPLQQLFEHDTQGRTAFAVARAAESIAKLSALLVTELNSVINKERSLYAGQCFLEGVDQALNDRQAFWETMEIDCSGRPASANGASVLLDRRLAGYDPRPPVWFGGPSRNEVLRETWTDLSSWLAAYFLAPSLFSEAGVPIPIRSLISRERATLSTHRTTLESLRESWEARERTIENINSNARGTISLVWFKEGDIPAAAADRVLSKLDMNSNIAADLNEAIGTDLAAFLAMQHLDQTKHLLKVWTGGVVLKETSKVVQEVPLATSRAAQEPVRTLLALNPKYASRKYFRPLGSAQGGALGQFADPLAKYHITREANPTAGYSPVGGHLELLRNLDLKYEEAVGFTLYDIDHFRTWLGRLLKTPSVLGSADPYHGVGRYLAEYVSIVGGFIRDMLVNWDSTGQTPTGLWPALQLSAPPLIQVAAGDVILLIGGNQKSVWRDWDTSRCWLQQNPAQFQQVIDSLRAALNTTDRDMRNQRWVDAESITATRYPSAQYPADYLPQLRIRYTSPTGDLAHLFPQD